MNEKMIDPAEGMQMDDGTDVQHELKNISSGEESLDVPEMQTMELNAELQIPKDQLNDQWKRGGICQLCRRKDYCKTQCRANRDFASVRIKEYIRRKTGIDKIEAVIKGTDTPVGI